MSTTHTARAHHERWLEISEYWTTERMAAAIPEDVPTMTEETPAPPSALPGAFKTTLVQNPATSSYYRRAGALFYVREGVDLQGSASAITHNGILTAAHCLYGSKVRKYPTKAAYVPGYRDLQEPLGQWPLFGEPVVPDAWKAQVNRAWDYGFSKVGLGGKNGFSVLGNVTGHFELLVDRPELREWDVLGYPAVAVPGYLFDGHRMWSCQGGFTRQPALNTIGKEGNLTPGSSGGPWLVPGHLYANGVQSYDDGNLPGENFSPYFDSDVLKLYRKAFQS
ncbi:trypsin-like serine peptidase [Streptomyces sp. NPDC050528]|uniref:trypsin-like serine peptidase n=1 Tax=Streptomyces sp. NPDC050528 TaxID=3365623 RepID=UPI00379CEB68